MGQRHARCLNQRLGLAHIQLRAHTIVKTQLAQAKRVLARGQGLPGNANQLLVSQQTEVGVGHSRNQADLRGFAPFFCGQKLAQCGFFQAGNAAKKVKLIRSHCQAGGVDTGNALIRPGLAGTGHSSAHSRELIRPANLKLRPGLLDVEHGHAQVAVVAQRGVNQLAQPGVAEKALPFDVGSGGAVVC